MVWAIVYVVFLVGLWLGIEGAARRTEGASPTPERAGTGPPVRALGAQRVDVHRIDVHWAVGSRETRVHLTRGDGRALCGHPLRGEWTRIGRPGRLGDRGGVPCEACLSARETTRAHLNQAIEAGLRPATAARGEHAPSSWETEELLLGIPAPRAVGVGQERPLLTDASGQLTSHPIAR
ncbi:hypothetical protein [Saccharopolyspora sp. CA-218241]|uniref:hypothetical protein n=1 Tax=Saccharopolyspora sp. CA-218241 TaxID=3240027 RepID=UPI003D95F17B